MAAVDRLAWTPAAWDDYLYWQGQDRKQLRRINQLIQACLRDPFVGIGKPELLRENLSGCWSRSIDDEHPSSTAPIFTSLWGIICIRSDQASYGREEWCSKIRMDPSGSLMKTQALSSFVVFPAALVNTAFPITLA